LVKNSQGILGVNKKETKSLLLLKLIIGHGYGFRETQGPRIKDLKK
jgi:hypothetical protein